MADNQITPFRLIDQFTMGNFNQRINETNTALQNNDPRQWGLGSVASTIANNADLNDYHTATGFWGNANTATIRTWKNKPENWVSNEAMLAVYVISPSYVIQELYECQNRIAARRILRGTTWSPWEYLNPFMSIGVEYRTTERYNGKTVYVVLCECDNFLAPGSTGTFTAKSNGEVISNVSNIVDFGGNASKWYIPTFMFGGSFNSDDNIVQIEVRADGNGNIAILTYSKSRNLTSVKPLVWVKYTKTTD